MTQIAQIIAEIDRILNLFPKPHGEALPIDQNAYNLISDLKAFIESLPDEKQSDLEEEIKNYFNSEIGMDFLPSCDNINIARHFANWQKERIINKACEWLNKNVVEYHPRTGKLRPIVNINAFREAMEGEK